MPELATREPDDLESYWTLVRPEPEPEPDHFTEGTPIEPGFGSSWSQFGANQPLPSLGTAKTISCWFRTEAVEGQPIVAIPGRYRLQIVGGQIRFELEGPPGEGWGQSISTVDMFNDGLWHNVVVFARQPDATDPDSTVWIDAEPITIVSADPLVGLPPANELLMGEMALWDRELTEDEIKAAYNGGSPRLESLPAQDALIAFYAMPDPPPIQMGLDPGVRAGDVIAVTGSGNSENDGPYVVASVSHNINQSGSSTEVTIAAGTMLSRNGKLFEVEETVAVKSGDAFKIRKLPDPRSAWERLLDDEF